MRRFLLVILLASVALVPPAFPQYPAPIPGPQGLVEEWYARFLNRPPDAFAGGWIDALRQGQPPEAVLAQILGSPEYYAKGGGTPDGFLQTLYSDVVGRAPFPQELGYWLPRMSFMSPAEVAYHVISYFPQSWHTPAPGYYEPRTPGYTAGPTYHYRRPGYPSAP
jgi:hypothetical protein